MKGSSSRGAYLDHAATSPMRPEAVAAMLPLLTEQFGNPAGAHSVARSARLALDDAREDVARNLGCEPGEVVFTSSGTEAANLAILGSCPDRAGGIVCSTIEHHSVLRSCEFAGATTVPVDRSGTVNLDALSRVLRPGVRLVSVMLANNEVGTVQPFPDVEALVRRLAPQAVLHTDAVAAVGWLDVAGLAAGADLVSISAHKFGGPKGAGALVVRGGTRITSLLHGGEQERGRRPGTQDVAAAVGMAAALEVATANLRHESGRVRKLRDRLAAGIVGAVDGVTESGLPTSSGESQRDGKLVSSFHARFEGVDNEELLLLLDDAGICASAGAACASGALEPSHVLLAMGLSEPEARSAVRFSLGTTTTEAEIDYTLEVVPKLVEQLRS